MTDAEIDGLSGDVLDVAIANTLPYGEIPEYHANLGAAAPLLYGHTVTIGINQHNMTILDDGDFVLAHGSTDEAPSLICKSYLKLANRGA